MTELDLPLPDQTLNLEEWKDIKEQAAWKLPWNSIGAT